MHTQATLHLTDAQVEFIEETLSNNENASNDELVELFVEEGIRKYAAEQVLEYRMNYIMSVFIGNNTPIRNGTVVGHPFWIKTVDKTLFSLYNAVIK